MKAKKLPSGNWRARVYSHTDEHGKKVYKSFTAETKAEAEFIANKYKYDREEQDESDITVGQAIARYIESKAGVLSPSTVKGYVSCRDNKLQGIRDIPISKLTNHRLQQEITREAANVSPKTLSNVYGLFTASVGMFSSRKFSVTLPRRDPPGIEIPTTDQVADLINHVKGTQIEIALILAANLGLRRSEICALTVSDIDVAKGTVAINKALVSGADNQWYIKRPKTKAGNRVVTASKPILEYIVSRAQPDGRLLTSTPTSITAQYIKLKKKFNFPYRFHDLRHYNASVMLALGIPDKYAMERIGHSTPQMLKNVYQHTMKDKKTEVDQSVVAYFESTLNQQI